MDHRYMKNMLKLWQTFSIRTKRCNVRTSILAAQWELTYFANDTARFSLGKTVTLLCYRGRKGGSPYFRKVKEFSCSRRL